MNFFIMNKWGVFNPSFHTDNQCKKKGHSIFRFKMKLYFIETLDNDGFVFDHEDLNRAIETSEALFGSCEQMHQVLRDIVVANTPDELFYYKCTILPNEEYVLESALDVGEFPAFMEYQSIIDEIVFKKYKNETV